MDVTARLPGLRETHQSDDKRNDRRQPSERRQDLLRRRHQVMDDAPPLAGNENIPHPLPLMLPQMTAQKKAMRIIPAPVTRPRLRTTPQRCLHKEIHQREQREDQDHRIPEHVHDQAQDRQGKRQVSPSNAAGNVP